MTNKCTHPKAYVSKIGYYSVCNICGQTFVSQEERPTFIGATKINLSPETIESIKSETKKPKRKYTRRQKLDI